MSELCETCGANQAALHIKGGRTTYGSAGGAPIEEEILLHCCPNCARQYERGQSYEGLFPGLQQEQLTEEVRVVQVTPERTVLRVIRTESEPRPEEWSVVTSRLPGCSIGTQLTVVFTPAELEWLKGEREAQD